MDNLIFKLNTMSIIRQNPNRHTDITIITAILSIRLYIITPNRHNHHPHNCRNHQASAVVIVIRIMQNIFIMQIIMLIIIAMVFCR